MKQLNDKLRLALSSAAVALVALSLAGWCVYCNTATLNCEDQGKTISDGFCGSYDHPSPQGCTSYTKKCVECRDDPLRPRACSVSALPIGVVCITGSDCY
jgi:hypothetical protein